MSANQVRDIYPLAPLQQGMLFHSLSDAVPGIYCEQIVGEVRHGLDHARFSDALAEVVRRHDALRSAFVWQDVDEPLQVIQDAATLPQTLHDWRALDATAVAVRLKELLDRERRRGFDFGVPPLMRVDLARADARDVFVLTFHHAILDGWSVSILLRELVAIYSGLMIGASPPLDAPRPFREFVGWLRRRDPIRSNAFWADQLRGFTAPTPLVDCLLSRGEESDGSSHLEECLRLSTASTAAVLAAARRCSVTLNTFIQGAWAILLSRITGESDVVFGALVSGRPPELTGVESMTGVFINTVPVRVQLDGDQPVDAFLKALQIRNGRLREHEHVPLAGIQGATALPRGQALFESILVYENYPAEIESTIGGITAGTWTVHVRSLQVTNYPLHLMIVPGAELLLDLTFEAAAVGRAMATRLLATLSTLIETMAAQPAARLGSLALQTGASVDASRGRGPVRARPTASFRALFEVASETHALRTAATDRHRAWSYAELAQRARAGAYRLAAAGVGPEAIVALLGPRDVQFLGAVLAVLGTEAAFLPLDARHPATRQLDILERSAARVLVADPVLAAPVLDAFRDRGRPEPLCIAMAGLTDPVARPEWRPPSAVGPEQLAYVIYTSGSSGTPKGAMLEQRGLVNHLLAKLEELEISPRDIVAQTAPVCFDISIWQFLAPLLAGATVHICPDDIAFDATQLPTEVDRRGITVLETVPSLLQAMLDDHDRRGLSAPRLRRLRVLLSTGEALPSELCRAWLTRFPGIPVVNAYGPTECSDDVTHHVVHVAPAGGGTVPIGRPLPNMRLLVLDHERQELPVGFVGELFVGGAGVGRGYLAEPALTSRAFLEAPGVGAADERLYRTGDRVRQRDDGVFEFMGRCDDQVKIHGYRIELGEIEARLAEHSAVSGAAVVAAFSQTGGRLVAFVTERRPTADDDLRAFLRRALPEYMVPSAFVRRETLPVTANGKVDRHALVASAGSEQSVAASPVAAPRDKVEAALVAVWAEVLRRDVGVDQNFFELGGDSMLMMQVVSRAAQLGMAVTVRQMFEHQTVEAVARAVRRDAPPMSALDGHADAAPLTATQTWFFELDVPRRHHWNMSLRLPLRERLDWALLRRAVEQVVAHHDALRLRFAYHNGEWCTEVSHNAQDVCTRVETSGLAPGDRREGWDAHELALQESLDLEHGPLLRVALLDTDTTEHSELLLLVHHLVADAVSLRILLEDLESTYWALKDGRAPALPPTTSFGEWAWYLRAHAESAEARAEWEYWLAVGGQTRATLRLDDPRAPNVEAAARIHEVWLDPADTETLIRSLPRHGIAAHDALLTALAETIAQHASPGEILVDVEGHGRHGFAGGPDVSRTVGWFTAIYPLTLGDARALGVSERYALVRAARERVPRGGVGYGLLRYLDGESALIDALRALPAPEVSFNYFGQVDAAFAHSRLFASGREGRGPDRDPQARRPHLLDVSAGVFEGRLRLLFLYASGAWRPETASAFATAYVAALRLLLAVPAAAIATSAATVAEPDDPQLTRAGTPGRAPMSFAQQGLWLLEQVRPGTAVSNSSAALRLEGALDVVSLQRSLDEIVRRHEPLRARFHTDEGRPVIAVVEDARVELEWREWPALDRGVLTDDIARWAESDSRRPFDLAVDPPLRTTLLRLGPQDCVLVVTAHHVAFDGWSFGVFSRELLTLYDAFRAGRSSPLPELPVEYSDYARWQRARLRGPRLTALLDWWRRRLHGAAPVHDLALDRARPSAMSLAGLHRRRHLPTALSDAARAYAQAHRTTLFVVLLTALNLELARRSTSKDILIGATVAGRPQPALEGLIGVFVNTVVVRTDLSGVHSFDVARQRTAANVVDALQHTELPFELLVEELRPAVRASHAPIVQIGFAMQNMPMPRIAADGLRVTPLEIDNRAARTDLVLFATDAEDGIRLSLEYSTDIFDSATADGLLRDIERCLAEGVEAGREITVDDIDKLEDDQVDALLRQLGARQ